MGNGGYCGTCLDGARGVMGGVLLVRERKVVWRVIQRLLKQDWGQANVVWDHTR